MEELSVVVNTLNEEKRLPRALDSVKGLAGEIVVVDMNSSDKTREVAERYGANVFLHQRTGYVEPARNFAISKARKNWILILDADEEITPKLAEKIEYIISKPSADYYRIPRKNIIFGKWIKYSRWWPDYNIRLFKKGKVSWSEIIHSVPITEGKGEDLPCEEKYAIVHQNYASIDDYLERMGRYTSIRSKSKVSEGYKFIWKDLITKPAKEFLSRYFAAEGYKDGLHGLALSLLQAFSEVILYLKIWQEEKFQEQGISLDESVNELKKEGREVGWWIDEVVIKSKGFFASLPKKVKRIINP